MTNEDEEKEETNQEETEEDDGLTPAARERIAKVEHIMVQRQREERLKEIVAEKKAKGGKPLAPGTREVKETVEFGDDGHGRPSSKLTVTVRTSDPGGGGLMSDDRDALGPNGAKILKYLEEKKDYIVDEANIAAATGLDPKIVKREVDLMARGQMVKAQSRSPGRGRLIRVADPKE